MVRIASWSVLAVLLAAVAAIPLPVAARGRARVHGPVVQLMGQVTTISAPDGSPTRFTMLTSNSRVSVKIAPHTTFTAFSAEAEVEGLRVGDYAVVRARHARGGWIALRITFDVRPIHVSDQATWIASVVRETPNGRYLIVRLPSGVIRWVMLDAQTKFRAYGELTSTPPAFGHQAVVHIDVLRTPRGWLAVEIDLMTGALPQPR